MGGGCGGRAAGTVCVGGWPRLLYRRVHVYRGRLEGHIQQHRHLAHVLVGLLEEIVLVYSTRQGWG